MVDAITVIIVIIAIALVIFFVTVIFSEPKHGPQPESETPLEKIVEPIDNIVGKIADMFGQGDSAKKGIRTACNKYYPCPRNNPNISVNGANAGVAFYSDDGMRMYRTPADVTMDGIL